MNYITNLILLSFIWLFTTSTIFNYEEHKRDGFSQISVDLKSGDLCGWNIEGKLRCRNIYVIMIGDEDE